MAKKTNTKKSITKTATPIVPTVHFTVDGDVKTFEVPQKVAAINPDICPARIFDGHRLLLRIDSFTAAWVLQTETFVSEDECSMLHTTHEFLPWVHDTAFETYDEDTDEWRMPTIEDFFNALKKEFEQVGCVYFVAAFNGLDILNTNTHTDFRCRFLDTDKEQIVSKGVLTFNAKYEPGKNLFYHADGNRALRASRIDTLTICKRSGYQPSIKYTMADGNNVDEQQICTAEMAHEWINSKS